MTPSWALGLSINVDYWEYALENVITQMDVNTTAENCVATGDPVFCNLIDRFPDGGIFQIQQPTLNFGKLDTSGYDIGIRYLCAIRRPATSGSAMDATYIDKYDSVVFPVSAPWRWPVRSIASTATMPNGAEPPRSVGHSSRSQR